MTKQEVKCSMQEFILSGTNNAELWIKANPKKAASILISFKDLMIDEIVK